MKKVIKWSLGTIGLLLLAVIVLIGTGTAGIVVIKLMNTLYAPDGEFDAAAAAPAPEYADPQYWAALPQIDDPADLVPIGVSNSFVQGDSPVDVFYIHPTGFLAGTSWTSELKADSETEQNTQWMLAHQASAFNGCCNLFAPRYRQASIFAYFADPEVKHAVLNFAYGDVVKAFHYYIDHFNQGRPFMLASHSQGTHHALRLLQEQIAGTPLADRLVAAYLIGGVMNPVTSPYLDTLPGINACASATDIGCVVSWDTYADGGARGPRHDIPALCTNPLSWRTDEELAPAELHLGALPPSGPFKTDFSDDKSVVSESGWLRKPLPGYSWAQCRDGVLYVADQAGTDFEVEQPFDPTKSRHLIDYSLFYMNIRANAMQRTQAWLAEQSQQ